MEIYVTRKSPTFHDHVVLRSLTGHTGKFPYVQKLVEGIRLGVDSDGHTPVLRFNQAKRGDVEHFLTN